MASQISHGFCERIPVSQPKNRCFHGKIATRVVSECVHRCPYFRSQKTGFSSGAGVAKLQKNVILFAERCFDCTSLTVQSRNAPVSRKLMNFQRKQSFLGTRIAQINGHTAALDANSLLDGQSGARISRSGRMDAQNALFDYLHSTRSLSFTDAEHMSKNSPVFLQKLTAKLENEQDIGRSLARFLRYNPINEFEPFFESLGLKPSEFHPLLPRNLIFLTDDDVLLENYHVLCNYGVPRSKIGKMYREAMEIFRYDCGVLSLKLQAYEELGLSRPTIIKLATCCPQTSNRDVNVEFLNVVDKLKTFGIELDWLRGCLSDKMSKFEERGSTSGEIDCLVNVGLDCHTVSEMVKLAPPLLNQSTDVTEKKIDYLLNHLGYPLEALVAFPTFLCYNMEKIKLRFTMYAWLKERGIVRSTKNRKIVNSNVALSTILACSDARFLKYFVNLHPGGLQEWERLKELSSSS
ncbi:hypothetical protein J5N97_000732 [Dioscorea zingiberensis]|uniref:Uncharacterized protein n=1 Tax=Dioscorea zingiberensis TaxID=325984 RepID=A0A9D5BUQ4_9LILI|nr:hypothetical protein J5N97_000732 [Dioscorea zingiberensis]